MVHDDMFAKLLELSGFLVPADAVRSPNGVAKADLEALAEEVKGGRREGSASINPNHIMVHGTGATRRSRFRIPPAEPAAEPTAEPLPEVTRDDARPVRRRITGKQTRPQWP